ncbi:unnamed protein product [Discula destructiva]
MNLTTPKFSDYCADGQDIKDNDDELERDPKRRKLSDDGWIEQALDTGNKKRVGPDPNPMPRMTSLPLRETHFRMRLEAADHQQPAKVAPSRPIPSDAGQSPGARSLTLSRRPSSPYSTRSSPHSPALTLRSSTPGNRQSVTSPPAGSVAGRFSDLEVGSRANSEAADDGGSSATFGRIHNVPRVELPARTTANLSKLETLPRRLFMRIMMHCGYKEQVLLKKCSYSLYHAVDLEIIPWEKKTETILFEECYNPRNFLRQPSIAQRASEEEQDDVDGTEGTGTPKKTARRKRARPRANDSSPAPLAGKAKAHSDTYGKWGCYSCYKILPAHYFEGALLEDKQVRTPRHNKLRSTNAIESDKKVDMRIEHVQILEVIPGLDVPGWLSQDKVAVDATDVDTYIRQRMTHGVDCDDLRAYYKDITRDSHLVAPLRGITPVFTPLSTATPSVNLKSITEAHHSDPTRSPSAMYTNLPAIHTREEERENLEQDLQTSKPLYKLDGGTVHQGDIDSTSYTYELHIPREAMRDERPLTLPSCESLARICLPSKTMVNDVPVLAPGDVVPLRRVCIPCGTKFAIYRRDSNRKIISKTDEQWWACDCFEVRAAGRSTGCSTCGRKVIY